MTKTIFISGATAGIGEATTRLFAREGWNLIICGRRKERLDEIASELGEQVKIHTFSLDVRDRKAVDTALEGLPKEFQEIDVLVNNAGLASGLDFAHEAKLEDWDTMIDTNIRALVYITHRILPRMVARRSGQIVNIGSVAGSYPYPRGNVYGATKAFVHMFSNNLRSDLVDKNVRITNIEPGMVETEFSLVRFHGNTERAKKTYAGTTPLSADDIAQTVHWVVSRPEHVNVNLVEIMPTCQAWDGFKVARSS